MKPDSESIRIAVWNIRQAIKRGDRQSARRLAMLSIALDSSSEEPWLYLAAISSPHASVYYLKQVLKINPDNLRARKGLQWAEARVKREQLEKTDRLTASSTENPEDISQSKNEPVYESGETDAVGLATQPLSDQGPANKLASSTPADNRSPSTVIKGLWDLRFRRFSSHWQNWVGLILVVLFIMIALAAPLLSPADSKTPGPFIKVTGYSIADLSPHSPTLEHILGTLPGQLDGFHALIWGTRDALAFGLEVAILAALFGLIYGAISGYTGGVINSLMMRVTDSFLAFPVFAGVVFITQLWASAQVAAGGIFSPRDNTWWFWSSGALESPIQKLMQAVNPLVLILILFSWMPYARITNTVVASLKNMEFIEAARSLGARSSRIIFRHILPNSIAPALVLAARDVGAMVILQATFTFIGLDGSSTWGKILVMGRDWILGPKGGVFNYWWVYVPATLMLALFGIGWNLFGDGISEAFDPREQ